MHVDPVAVVFIPVGAAGILFRRASARHYLRVLRLTERIGTGSISGRTAERISIAVGRFFLAVGIAALLLD